MLPLINNSIYSGLVSTLGGSPDDLDQLPIPARNIFSIGARSDNQHFLANLGIEPTDEAEQLPEQVAERKPLNLNEITRSLQQLGLAIDKSFLKLRSVDVSVVFGRSAKNVSRNIFRAI